MKTEMLTNSFHGTQIRIVGGRAEWDRLEMLKYTGRATASEKAKYNRIRRALCGSEGCTCGVVRG